jgi:thioredoxin-related protein
MKRFLITLFLSIAGFIGFAQQNAKLPLYDTAADAKADIKKAVALASKEHKNVMLQVGGNWCIWCTRFHNTVSSNDTLSKLMKDNYIVVHVNYEQKNSESVLWKELGYPQRFGFPVFVILDEKGNRIHTQNSGYLEEGKGHSPAKIAEFLEQWSPAALRGATLRN